MIINFHPKEIESHAGKKLIEKMLAEKADEVVHITEKTVEEWQAIIKSNEVMRFVGPVYWWGLGHDFDKWAQDVLKYNFAFSFDTGAKVGLLDGWSTTFDITHGTPSEYAAPVLANVSDRLKNGIVGYCGGQVEIKFYFDKDL